MTWRQVLRISAITTISSELSKLSMYRPIDRFELANIPSLRYLALVKKNIQNDLIERDKQYGIVTDLIKQRSYQRAVAVTGQLYYHHPDDTVVKLLRNALRGYSPSSPTEDARRHVAEANIYLEQRDYTNAITAYRNVIKTNPWWGVVYYNLAHVYATNQQHGKAIRTMKHYLMLQPHSTRSRKAKDAIYKWETLKEQSHKSVLN